MICIRIKTKIYEVLFKIAGVQCCYQTVVAAGLAIVVTIIATRDDPRPPRV